MTSRLQRRKKLKKEESVSLPTLKKEVLDAGVNRRATKRLLKISPPTEAGEHLDLSLTDSKSRDKAIKARKVKEDSKNGSEGRKARKAVSKERPKRDVCKEKVANRVVRKQNASGKIMQSIPRASGRQEQGDAVMKEGKGKGRKARKLTASKDTVKSPERAGCSYSFEENLFSSSGSEDEWLDVEGSGKDVSAASEGRDIEVTIKEAPQVETEESKAARYLRLELNRRIRERQINCHKMHLLCYIAHLRIWTRALVRSEVLRPLCFSLIPDGYVTAALHSFDISLAERFLKWITSAFLRSELPILVANESRSAQMDRLEKLISDKVYESDRDIACITFLFFLALKQSARLVLSCQPTALKMSVDELLAASKKKKAVDVAESLSSSGTELKKNITEEVEQLKSNNKRRNSENRKRKKKVDLCLERNYWVEYWDEGAERWICVDPWTKTVDSHTSFEQNVTAPMQYVIAVDDAFGLRDVTAWYSARFLYNDVRRLRVDAEWWNATLKLFRSKNRARERLEDVQLHDYLMSLPMPTNIADFKNHPLYVLKKDLLKFEAIYPPDQQPVGRIRDIDIYPRSCVYHLDGSLNWMKQARSIKPGEKPYKVVKARPNMRIPKEVRQPDKTLDLYGFWQTEPYVPQKVTNVVGRLPRNEHGNLYLYKKSMLPEGCAYLQLDGIYSIARRLNLECVPCVVGWEFHKNGNHPILDGCAVLKEDEQVLREAWSEEYEKKIIRAKKKRRERAKRNWRRLYRGVLLMKKVRAEFLSSDNRNMKIDERFEASEDDAKNVVEDTSVPAWPMSEFTLPLTDISVEKD